MKNRYHLRSLVSIFPLSYRDLVRMKSERGVHVSHTTIMRWTIRYASEFEHRWRRFGRRPRASWRVDETYLKVEGDWMYYYRAVDQNGETVDSYLSKNRNVRAAGWWVSFLCGDPSLHHKRCGHAVRFYPLRNSQEMRQKVALACRIQPVNTRNPRNVQMLPVETRRVR
jgi:hypothetical protein